MILSEQITLTLMATAQKDTQSIAEQSVEADGSPVLC
jgi:hypothetical protein